MTPLSGPIVKEKAIVMFKKLVEEADEQFRMKFENLLKEHKLTPDEFYNIDETGLNFKMLLQKTSFQDC